MPTRKRTVTADAMQFALCRSMGHEWHHEGPIGSDDQTHDHFRRPFGGSFGMVGLPSTCKQCGTERMRWITRTGESHVRYHHPDGYAQHGEDRMRPVEWRRTYVASIFDAWEAPAKRKGKVAK